MVVVCCDRCFAGPVALNINYGPCRSIPLVGTIWWGQAPSTLRRMLLGFANGPSHMSLAKPVESRFVWDQMRSFAGCQEHYGSLPRAPNADEPPGAAIGGECAVRDGIGVDSEVVAEFFFCCLHSTFSAPFDRCGVLHAFKKMIEQGHGLRQGRESRL